ncbi:hypothetical protein AVEN_243616-1 [Araneus ventricosus]|uniref:Uncharacterized protein n=1 Tax=Araneus ventricosus TaxID=182803 RepID=A0A4Y2A5C4_ARAVE|nr:hypothetical protein AVEN_243616-1 [Araneus ventricosus]
MFIDLGGSFMEAPLKPHNRLIQSPTAIVPTPPPAFKTGFRFCESGSLSLPTIIFQFYGQRAEWKAEPDENPNISATSRPIFTGFWHLLRSTPFGAVSLRMSSFKANSVGHQSIA